MSNDTLATPSNKRSAYTCIIQCSFQALHLSNIKLLVQMLQMHQDYVGFYDEIKLLSEEGREMLAATQFWDPFAMKVIIGIKHYITGDNGELAKMKKNCWR